MPEAVIHIGSDGVGTLLARVDRDGVAPVLARQAPLRPPLTDVDAIHELVLADRDRCLAVGAGAVEVLISPSLRGSYVLRGLRRRLEASGVGAPRMLSATEEAELIFLGAAPGRGEATAVVRLGETVDMAVGMPGARPAWWASRSVSARSLTRAAAGDDPPTPVQLRAIASAARRELRTLHPPPSRHTVVTGSLAGAFELLLGPEPLDEDRLAGARSRLSLGPSELVAAQLGVETSVARQLPAALEVLDAVGGLVGMPIEVAHGGLAEGALLAAAGEREPGGGSRSAPVGIEP